LKIKEEESTNMATRDSVSQSPQKEGKLPYWHLDFRASDPQSGKIINLRCCKPLGLQQFVIAAMGIEHSSCTPPGQGLYIAHRMMTFFMPAIKQRLNNHLWWINASSTALKIMDFKQLAVWLIGNWFMSDVN
jgi:hypothetical protein